MQHFDVLALPTQLRMRVRKEGTRMIWRIQQLSMVVAQRAPSAPVGSYADWPCTLGVQDMHAVPVIAVGGGLTLDDRTYLIEMVYF